MPPAVSIAQSSRARASASLSSAGVNPLARTAELFCMHAQASSEAGQRLQESPDDVELSKLMDRHTSKAASLAIKLRITTSAEHGGRKAADQGIRDEPGSPLDGLLGGHALGRIETREH
jgi:hypothetical protein